MTLPTFSRAIQLIMLTKRIVTGAAIVFFAWLLFFHWTGVHQVAITRNVFTGEMQLDSVAGFDLTLPWVQVTRIDTRPHRLCVDCDCRSLNCRLVEFDPAYWREFVDREGFRYYWWSNRFSYNSGASQEYRGLEFIFRGYAFDNESHPFLKIIKE